MYTLNVEVLACGIRQHKEIKGIEIGNKQIKLSQFAILYLKQCMRWTNLVHILDKKEISKKIGLKTLTTEKVRLT